MERGETTIIYQSLLIGIILLLVALPLVKVPVSVSARGTVRPIQENTKVISLVSGRVVMSGLYENNQLVHAGDTLLVVTSEALYSKKDHQQRQGRVHDVNNNLLANEQTGEFFFTVRCQLDRDYLSLKNGYKAQVGKGHTYTARFYLTDRTLWQLLFDRMDDWFNPRPI